MIKSIKRYCLILFSLTAIQFGIFSSVRALPGPCETMLTNCLLTAFDVYENSEQTELDYDILVAFATFGVGYCAVTYLQCN